MQAVPFHGQFLGDKGKRFLHQRLFTGSPNQAVARAVRYSHSRWAEKYDRGSNYQETMWTNIFFQYFSIFPNTLQMSQNMNLPRSPAQLEVEHHEVLAEEEDPMEPLGLEAAPLVGGHQA